MAASADGEAGRDAAEDQQLHRSEERFRLLVESVVDYAIFLLDPDGYVESWNAGAQRLKGYTEDEILGQHYSVFYPPEYREDGLPEQLLARASELGHVEHSGWRVRKDGSRFWANVVITELRDASGDLAGFAKVTRDMTELHETEQAREQALEERQQALTDMEELVRWRRDFTDWVIHDLQTPVFSIAGFVNYLQTGETSETERSELLERIASNARSMQDLVDNLRAYTLLSDGHVELRKEPVALRPFVTRLLYDMAPVLAEHPVAVDVEPSEIVADAQALERILRNLLGNAVRHTPEGTAVHVLGRRDGDTVSIAVADEGPGIPEQLLPRVFDRLERGGRGGTGLGLGIAKRYAELHGGGIEVSSEPGEGTTVRVTLPHGGDAVDDT